MPWTDPRTGERDYDRERLLLERRGGRAPKSGARRARQAAEQRVMRVMAQDPRHAGEFAVLLAAERSREPVLGGERRDAPDEWDKATGRALQRALRALADVHRGEFRRLVVEEEDRLRRTESGCTVGA